MNVGKTLIIVGVALILFGMFFVFFKSYFNWFGNLFGDISYKTESFHFYMPLTSMIILSIFLSLFFNILSRFFDN